MKISVVGAGYVGLVTAACLASRGHEAVLVDVDPERVHQIASGHVPFYEPGLNTVLKETLNVRLHATVDLDRTILETDLTFVCVGTPSSGGAADLTQIRHAATGIGRALARKSAYHVVVVKSTVPPGTTDDVVTPLLVEASGKLAGERFGVGMNPEFLTEGEALHDFMEPDRIILGGADGRVWEALGRVYESFRGVPILRTGNKTAEMIKYASNALLATMISFSNEFAGLCEAVGDVDVADVLRGVHLSRYLSPRDDGGIPRTAPITSFLWAGCGYGGSCLPKDVQALVSDGRRYGHEMGLLEAVQAINERQPRRVVEALGRHFPTLKGVNVAIMGLSFRPDTDDMRESPAVPIIDDLIALGARVTAYDPKASRRASQVLAGRPVLICEDLDLALADAQAVVVVTPWDEFRSIPARLAKRTPSPLVFDCRRMLDPGSVARYDGIGFADRRDIGQVVRTAYT